MDMMEQVCRLNIDYLCEEQYERMQFRATQKHFCIPSNDDALQSKIPAERAEIVCVQQLNIRLYHLSEFQSVLCSRPQHHQHTPREYSTAVMFRLHTIMDTS